MSSWIDTVKETFKKGRLSNPSYQFKDALKDAKKIYNKGKDEAKIIAKKTRKTAKKLAKKSRNVIKYKLDKRKNKSSSRRTYKNRK